jgi:hypothetical protein
MFLVIIIVVVLIISSWSSKILSQAHNILQGEHQASDQNKRDVRPSFFSVEVNSVDNVSLSIETLEA